MELYKITATCSNNSTTKTFDYIPENFEGVKIAQSFSFVNPIGYTPKFTIDTMRVVLSDKTFLDTIFATYGLESDVILQIQKLNAGGTSYEDIYTFNFAVDFESYEMMDVYSEFALKSISVIDEYNKIKNTEVQIALTEDSSYLPTTQKYINYVSLKKTIFEKGTEPNYGFLKFQENNPSKIFDSSTALYSNLVVGYNTIKDADIYRFSDDFVTSTKKLNISASGELIFNIGTNLYPPVGVTLKLYKNNFLSPLYTFYNSPLVDGAHSVTFNVDKLELIPISFAANDVLYIAANVGGEFVSITGTFFFDIKIESNDYLITSDIENVKYTPISTALISFFGDVGFPFGEDIFNYGLTSANSIMKLNNFVNIKPKDFLSDLCAVSGLMLNFKLDGTAEIMNVSNYFNDLLEIDIDLNPINVIAITDFKELSIKHDIELNFASVSVGQDISTYDTYTYFIDLNKILTFSQTARNASENLDLTNTKLRTDFSGILDYFYRRSKQNIKPTRDNFIFNPTFTARTGTDASITMYDYFTPRDILNNWKKFLSFCFQNFGKNTLTISSNGGTPDNLAIDSVNQMDNITFAETPRLLPIEYNFTALIDNVDFSENILKLTHNSEIIYIFVLEAETTDKLTEQKIRGLKIQL